ncbi:hypothetical protein ERJ75_000682900 [Trypanosoma vivax]|nr:hypothetical protein ERJ75_000682900 [Trypanosoma vivax]
MEIRRRPPLPPRLGRVVTSQLAQSIPRAPESDRTRLGASALGRPNTRLLRCLRVPGRRRRRTDKISEHDRNSHAKRGALWAEEGHTKKHRRLRRKRLRRSLRRSGRAEECKAASFEGGRSRRAVFLEA